MARRPPASLTHPPSDTLAEQAAVAVREMVHDGVLLPGQPVRQSVIAQQLGVSRVPVREALKSLQAEGLVEPAASGGFVVVRLSADELAQVYLMRRLLETEMVSRIEAVPVAEIHALSELNHRMAALVDAPSRELRALNYDFHFRIFRLSGLTHVVAETARLWAQSAPYRSIYTTERDIRARIVAEHEAIVQALRDRDTELLVARTDQHRDASQREVISVLSRPERPTTSLRR